jgi:hypothetical protein
MKTKSKSWKIIKEIFIILLLLNLAGFLFAMGTIHGVLAFSLLASIATVFLILRIFKLINNYH